MDERPDENARQDTDAGREAAGDHPARAEAEKEYEDDPARNPEDDELEGLKGG